MCRTVLSQHRRVDQMETLTLFTVKLVSVTLGFGLILDALPFKRTASCSPFGAANDSRSKGFETVPVVVYFAAEPLAVAGAMMYKL